MSIKTFVKSIMTIVKSMMTFVKSIMTFVKSMMTFVKSMMTFVLIKHPLLQRKMEESIENLPQFNSLMSKLNERLTETGLSKVFMKKTYYPLK